MGIIRCKGYMYCTIGSDGWDGQNLGKIIIVDSSSCLCTLDLIFISCLMDLVEEGTAGDPRTFLLFVYSYVGRKGKVRGTVGRTFLSLASCQELTPTNLKPATARLQPCDVQGYISETVGRTTSVQPSWSISNIIITHPRDV